MRLWIITLALYNLKSYSHDIPSRHVLLVVYISEPTFKCRRPTTVQDRIRDSDEEDKDYDVAALANNLSQAFRYQTYDNGDNGEVMLSFSLIYERL